MLLCEASKTLIKPKPNRNLINRDQSNKRGVLGLFVKNKLIGANKGDAESDPLSELVPDRVKRRKLPFQADSFNFDGD
jgi:hypothetical protein